MNHREGVIVLERVQERKKIVGGQCGEGIRKIGELARSSPVDLGFADQARIKVVPVWLGRV